MAIHALFAGSDGPERRALPIGELLAPATLAAVAVLLVNDWVLKPWPVFPRPLAGKLSDLAGLVFAPLLVTALVDLALLAAARLGLPADCSLRPRKLAAAIALVGGLFAATKLSPAAAAAAAGALRTLGFDARIVADPTDLIALPMLALAWLIGRRELRRVPLGRLEVLARRWRRRGAAGLDLRAALDDAVRAGADPAAIDRLATAYAEYLRTGSSASRTATDAALAELR